jgi:acetyl-CoA C-acetyltransferase
VARRASRTKTRPDVDLHTPVLVGVGQACDRVDDDSYQALSAVDLAAQAARNAIADTGADISEVTASIDTVGGIRQFDISVPGAPSPLGRSDNYPRSVADRLGAEPVTAILEVSGGQSPQHLLTELARKVARGDLQVALLFGSEVISTVRKFAKATERPDFSERRGGQLDDRGFGLKGMISRYAAAQGLTDAPSQYALFENARRARLGLSRQAYAESMGELFAPFTRVAAKNPLAAATDEWSARQLIDVTERNRMIADPYPRFLVARDQVNQAAAVMVMSVGEATRLGVPAEKWVFLHGHADLREVEVLRRPDLSTSPASIRAVEHALSVAGVAMDDISFIDLYSCFPIAVSNICDGLGISPTDPRGLTLTGGLPYFGGPGNNYSMHAIAECVERLRITPSAYALIGANGGTLSKYSVGVYSTRPTSWREDRSDAVQTELDTPPEVDYAVRADGWATVETYTVKGNAEVPLGIVVGRLPDGARFIASTAEGDAETVAFLRAGEPIGEPIYVRSLGPGNVVCNSEDLMETLHPRSAPRLATTYEFAEVRREGHVLEVMINRPEARNCLTPEANQELEDIFDGYFADPDLWVAIITGAGGHAFSAGNDLRYAASGKPMWVPRTGFAGLTSRRNMTKPVIAAVNGYAMGGGFEIALACHLVVADITAQFALSEVKVGLAAGAGGLARLPRAIPEKIAHELILTGRRMSADEAARYGLVNRVTQPGQAMTAARALAAEITESSPTSVRISLEMMSDAASIADVVAAVEHPVELLDELVGTEDMIEGITSFVAKRHPQWKNR